MTRGWAVLLLVLALGLAPRAAFTEPPEPEAEAVRLTVEEAVARAREAAPRLAALRAAQRAADAGVRGAEAGRLPVLDLQASYNRLSEVPELRGLLPGEGVVTIFPNIPDNYWTRVGLSLPLYTGGRVTGSIDAARRLSEAAAADLTGADRDLVLETTTAFWALVTARENARVLREGLAAYEAHLVDARNREDQGLAARNERLSVQAARDRAELGRLEAENSAAVANADLVRLTGLPPGARVLPAEAGEAPAALPPVVEALVAEALGSRSELRAIRARAAAAEASLKVARAEGRPQATVAAGYEYANPNVRILPPEAAWKSSWNVGVSLAWTPFDGGRAAAATAQATAEAEALQRQAEDLEQHIRLEVTSAALEVETADRAVQAAASGLEAARESARVAHDRYREGLLPSAELLDTEAALLGAGLDQTAAAARRRVARARLDRALGH
jgi:outer membrane protein TolC